MSRKRATPGSERRAKKTPKRTLEILARGLGHLPFSAKQISRAKSLARDVRAHPAKHGAALHHEVDATALAAAIAYAIVYVDQVPLSAGEVGAPFRVSATRVRAAFEILRTELDLIRGDVRYATAML